MEKRKYFDTQDACRILNVTRQTLWNWRKLKGLKTQKIGGENFYIAENLRKFRRANCGRSRKEVKQHD